MNIIYNWDHFYPLTGEPNGKTLECWTVLHAGAAQSTSTAKIVPSRDPADIERSVGRDPDLHRPQLHELGITHFTGRCRPARLDQVARPVERLAPVCTRP